MFSREQILKLMRDKVTHPATPRELVRALRVPQEERATFSRHIKALVQSGELVQIKGDRLGLPDKMDLVVGRLQTHAGGFGFVIPDKTGEAAVDVYVSSANIQEAMHGDRVLVRVERKTLENRLEGRIIRILERGNSTVVGKFVLEAGLGYVQPFDRPILTDGHIPPGFSSSAEPGGRVLVEITTWPPAARGPGGKRSEGLGGRDE